MGDTTKKKTPVGAWVCNFTMLLERLAFYGSKPLILLFLITAVENGGVGVEAGEAAIIAANITAYTYLTPIVGGWITDQFLGARYALVLGCILMGAGWCIGYFANTASMVNLMIIVVAIGTGFFKGNLSAIQGRLFDDKDQLDAAFSIQYSFVNVGAFVGSLVTGYLYLHLFADGDVLGFRQCFLMSGAFCFIAGIWFFVNFKNLKGQGRLPFKFLTDTEGNVIGQAEKKEDGKKGAPLTSYEKRCTLAIALVALFNIIFWAFYYQQDIALTIYMTDYVNMFVGSFEIPPSWITTTLNGLLCVAMGPMFAKLWTKLAARPQGDLDMFQKLGLGFAGVGLAFLVMVLAELSRGVGASSDVKVSVLWMVLFSVVITAGEIAFSPLRNAFISKYAPKSLLSLLMGLMTMMTFFSSKLSAYIQVIIDKIGNIFVVFIAIFAVSMLSAVFMFLVHKKLNKLVEEE